MKTIALRYRCLSSIYVQPAFEAHADRITPHRMQTSATAAVQLDFDLYHYQQLIAWLASFPKERLEAMAQYASRRHHRLKDKHPLISGGLERLGALPVAAVLYLQFKDLHWPPQPTWPEFILGIAIVGLYWGSLLLVSIRFRAQLFALLLSQAAGSATTLRESDDQREGVEPSCLKSAL